MPNALREKIYNKIEKELPNLKIRLLKYYGGYKRPLDDKLPNEDELLYLFGLIEYNWLMRCYKISKEGEKIAEELKKI